MSKKTRYQLTVEVGSIEAQWLETQTNISASISALIQAQVAETGGVYDIFLYQWYKNKGLNITNDNTIIPKKKRGRPRKEEHSSLVGNKTQNTEPKTKRVPEPAEPIKEIASIEPINQTDIIEESLKTVEIEETIDTKETIITENNVFTDSDDDELGNYF